MYRERDRDRKRESRTPILHFFQILTKGYFKISCSRSQNQNKLYNRNPHSLNKIFKK